MAYGWIFFDLFDTLCRVDEGLYYEGKLKAAEAAGLDFQRFVAAWRGTSFEASTGKLKTPYERAAKALKAMGVEDRAAASEVARRDVETIQACVSFYGGAEEALATLRQRGFRLGLISNATATTAFIVSPLGLRQRLDLLVFSYEVGAVKPEPAIFQAALQRAGADASACLFVGDGANRELDAAAELGFGVLCMDHPEKAHSFRDKNTLSRPGHPRVGGFAEMLALPQLGKSKK